MEWFTEVPFFISFPITMLVLGFWIYLAACFVAMVVLGGEEIARYFKFKNTS